MISSSNNTQIKRPIPTDKQIEIDPHNMLVSRTDENGYIIYVNKYFCDISGYTEEELLSSAHNIIRHPDMPKAIFHLMWKNIQAGQNITALVKNLTKNGDYYWVTTEFEIKKVKNSTVQNYVAFGKFVPSHAVEEIETLYSKLLDIEKIHGLKASEPYLTAFFQERHTTYEAYIANLLMPKAKSTLLLKKVKSFFS